MMSGNISFFHRNKCINPPNQVIFPLFILLVILHFTRFLIEGPSVFRRAKVFLVKVSCQFKNLRPNSFVKRTRLMNIQEHTAKMRNEAI